MRKKKPIVPIKERSTRTAGFTCVCKAQAFYEKNPLLKGDDYIAPKMIPFSIKLLLKLKIIKLLSTIVPKSTILKVITKKDRCTYLIPRQNIGLSDAIKIPASKASISGNYHSI